MDQNDHTSEAVTPNTELQCYICQKSHKSRSDLRQHIYCHLKSDIQSKYYGEDPIKNCIECSYKSSIPEHILMHLALKHQKIKDFVPKEVTKMIYKDKSIKVISIHPNSKIPIWDDFSRQNITVIIPV